MLKFVSLNPFQSHKPTVQQNLAALNRNYASVMEKCCDIFDRLPVAECRRLFGDNTDAVLELRKLKSRMKAKVKQTERALQRLDSEQADAEAEANAMLEIEEQEQQRYASEAAASRRVASSASTRVQQVNAFTSQSSGSSSSNRRPSQPEWQKWSSPEQTTTAASTQNGDWNFAGKSTTNSTLSKG